MKKVTSVTFWNDAVGKRLSITYSEIDDTTGKIIRDNYRIDRVLVDKTAVAACDSIADVAQAFIDVCRHTYCSNMARAGMNPKTLQYLMGHSDIGVTMNTYTHLGLEDAQNEMIRLEELNRAKEEVAKAAGEQRPVTQRSFRAV